MKNQSVISVIKQLDKLTDEVVNYLVTKNQLQGQFITRTRLLINIGLFLFGFITLHSTVNLLFNWHLNFAEGALISDLLFSLLLSKIFQCFTFIVSALLTYIFFKTIRKIRKK